MDKVAAMIGAVLALLPEETVKSFVDAGFDAIEDKVKATDNKIDDAVVLPIMNKIRKTFNIPDNDEVVAEPTPETPTEETEPA